jgi:hypothetical protein
VLQVDHIDIAQKKLLVSGFATTILLLSPTPRNISMLDHVPNLSFHGNEKQGKEIEKEYWPENRYVEYFKKSHSKCNNRCPIARVPKFELWKASGKWSANLL